MSSLGLTVSGGRATTSPDDADHALDPQVRQGLERGPVGMADQLHQPARLAPARVAQVDEQQAAVVALGRHPARPGAPSGPTSLECGATRPGRPGSG